MTTESLRLREDALVAEALLGPYTHSNGSIDLDLERCVGLDLSVLCGVLDIEMTQSLCNSTAVDVCSIVSKCLQFLSPRMVSR
jgi:hypothetical protein